MGSIGLFTLLGGFAMLLNGSSSASWLMVVGTVILVVMMIGWFGTVIGESESGTYNAQVDLSFRQGMLWFIFSEVLFFAAFFGALFYARIYSVPWLAGEGAGGMMTGPVLWPGYEGIWPTNGPGDIGGTFDIIPAFGIPFINTVILVSSGGTVTLAHWALKKNERAKLCWWLFATVALGLLFLALQAYEFAHAYADLNLTLGSRGVRVDLLHADRISRTARDDRCDHADRDADPIDARPLHSGAPLRVRGRGVVLALRRRGVDRVVHLRLLALIGRRPRGRIRDRSRRDRTEMQGAAELAALEWDGISVGRISAA